MSYYESMVYSACHTAEERAQVEQMLKERERELKEINKREREVKEEAEKAVANKYNCSIEAARYLIKNNKVI